MYNIKVDTAHNVLEATLGGLMPLDEVAAYMSDLKRTIGAHSLGGNYSMIIDVSACPIQSQDMIKAMGGHMATMPKARSLAIVTSSTLARMQIRRLFTQPYARIVSTFEEARAWVISGIEPAA